MQDPIRVGPEKMSEEEFIKQVYDSRSHLYAPTNKDGVFTYPPGHPEFEKILDEIRELHRRKSADYGNKEDLFANINASKEFGIPAWLGAMVRANDKVSRIKTYANKKTLANESLEDSLLDLAAYAIISLVLFREQNNGSSHSTNPNA